jgi:hypothetical protein
MVGVMEEALIGDENATKGELDNRVEVVRG